MAKKAGAITTIVPTKKRTSQGIGGRGRKVQTSTSTMPKRKKRTLKSYRGQGR